MNTVKAASILSIQSHVVSGHVGNRSAVFPLELLGHEVLPLNTVQFSSHTGKKGWKGTCFSGAHIRDLVDGLDAVQALADCTAVLSGYIGSLDIGLAIINAVQRIRTYNPAALYCCDPVMGDHPGGFYVQNELFDFFRTQALALADIVTPNHFEAELLSGLTINTELDASRVADRIHELGPKIILVTSCLSQNSSSLQLLLSCSEGKFMIETPLLPFPAPPKGSGDLFSALFLGHYLHNHNAQEAFEESTNTVWSILERTLQADRTELMLVQARDLISNPPSRFRRRRIGS